MSAFDPQLSFVTGPDFALKRTGMLFFYFAANHGCGSLALFLSLVHCLSYKRAKPQKLFGLLGQLAQARRKMLLRRRFWIPSEMNPAENDNNEAD